MSVLIALNYIQKRFFYPIWRHQCHFTRLFIALAKKFLHTCFDGIKPNRANNIIIIEFNLVVSPQLLDLHKKILSTLFSLYENKEYQQYILQLLFSYSQTGFEISIRDIVEYDSKLISSFLSKNLDSNNLYHCIIVQQYLQFLKRFNIKLEENLNVKFKPPGYLLYDLLTNKLEGVELRLADYDKYREYRSKKIAKLTLSYSKEDYDRTFHQLLKILEMSEGHTKWQINQGILSIFEELSRKNPDLFCEVLKNYLEQGDYLEIEPWWIVSSLLSAAGVAKAFDIINLPDYPSKHRWLFHYYQHLPKDNIKQEQVDAVRELYKIAEYKYFISHIDYLLKYENIETGLIADVVAIVMERANTVPELAYQLISIFNRHTEINKQLKSLFFDNFILLENAYIVINNINNIEKYADNDGTSFSVLLDNDHAFIDRYLKERFSRKNYLNRHDDSRDYSFIWLRDDFMNIIQRITSVIYEYQCKNYYVGYYHTFFTKGVHSQTNNMILEKQDQYLLKEIESKFDDADYIRFLFSVIVEFSPERKLLFYKAFLGKNKNFDAFKNISNFGWIGSAVPMLQGKIDFYEKIVNLCNSSELLKHRYFIEQKINYLRKKIQDEKKRDFTEL